MRPLPTEEVHVNVNTLMLEKDTKRTIAFITGVTLCALIGFLCVFALRF